MTILYVQTINVDFNLKFKSYGYILDILVKTYPLLYTKLSTLYTNAL